MTETKMVINPRVEIDTSPPFESVKQAVNHFGGSGAWIPQQLLHLDVDHHDTDAIDLDKMEEHTAQLERVLISRERETLNVLRELEEAKKLVVGLKKAHLLQEKHFSIPSEDSTPNNLNLMNLDQARVNLNRTTIDLAVIRASVESLNTKMSKRRVDGKSNGRKVSTEDNHRPSRAMLDINQNYQIGNGTDIKPDEDSQFKFEADQYKKMVEASRYEVMKAMSEIERTKASIKMAEMRLNAARKIEEAAKAVEAIAFAEKNAMPNAENYSDQAQMYKPEEITLPFDEYNVLSYKARQAEEMCKTKFMDTKETYKKTSLEAAFDNDGGFDRKDSCLLNSNESNKIKDKAVPVYRSNISMGDLLRRKLVVQDDDVVEKHVEVQGERQQVSLSQMLGEQSGLILNHTRSVKDGSTERHYFEQKKKFGFIHVVLPRNKKKSRVLN